MSVSHPTTSPLLLYAPTLHRELAPVGLPPGVLFMHPGLPGKTDRDQWLPDTYPLRPKAAKAVLAELLVMGQAMDATGIRGLRAGTAHPSSGIFSDEERNALARIAADGNTAKENAMPLAAQKTLLLSWDLEERLLELAVLQQQIAEAGKALTATLREDSDEEAADFFLPLETGIEEPDWQITLTAIAAFLPPDAALVTAHPGMRQSLEEAKLLHPLPDGMPLTKDWPRALRAATLWCNAPLWQILGRTRAPKDRHDLSRSPHILVCPAG